MNDPSTQTPAAESPGADARRERAIRTVREAAFAALLAADTPQRTTDLARSVAERLGLATDEASLGAVAPLVRLVLDSDRAFALTARQWDLSAREGGSEAERKRPVERTIEELLQLVGRPAAAHEIAPLVAAIYGREPEYYQSMIERMAPTRPQFFVAPMGRIGLSRWLLEITSDDPMDVELDNFRDPEELAPARAAMGKVESAGKEPGSALDLARALIQAADAPLTNRALSFVIWQRMSDIEPLALFNDLLVTEPDSLRPGPQWESAAAREANRAAILELAGSPELAQEAVAAAAPAQEVVTASAPAQTVGDEDLEQVYGYMSNDLRTYRLAELCQEVLESFPGSRNFTAVRDALWGRMRSDPRFIWVGTERFRLDGTMPDDIEAIPEGLSFDDREYGDEEGEAVDKLLPPERWKHLLEQQVEDLLVQDLGDDDTSPSGAPERVRAVIPLHHYVAGTLYVHHQDRPFFPLEPDLVSLDVHTPDGARHELWLNNQRGLVFGLKEWYDANLPWTGGVFTLEPTDQPGEYRLLYSGETEETVEIPMDRLQTLLQLRGAAEMEALSLTEVLTRLLKGQAGIPFVGLFTQVNVARRSRRVLVASVLSGHRGFQQRPEQPGVWFFDERRADKAKSKGGKPKRVREYDFVDEDIDVDVDVDE